MLWCYNFAGRTPAQKPGHWGLIFWYIGQDSRPISHLKKGCRVVWMETSLNVSLWGTGGREDVKKG